MSTTASNDEMVEVLAGDMAKARHTVDSLGAAIRSADIQHASPSLARATVAAENLYDQIEAEFGLLTSAQAGARMGSRSSATRNLAVSARKTGRLLGLQRGRYLAFPGFQFNESGVRAVIADLIVLGQKHRRTEAGLIQWLMSPTTYLAGQRPVDVIQHPDILLRVAADSFGVEW